MLKFCMNRKYIFFIFLIYGFVLQNFFESTLSDSFSYIDEVIALFFMCYSLKGLATNRQIRKKQSRIYIAMFIVVLCAVISTGINNYQPFFNAVLDLFANIKFFFAFSGGVRYFRNFDLGRYAKKISLHVKFVSFMFMVLAVLSIVFKISIYDTTSFSKYGIRPLSLIYGHPATLSVVCLFLFAILTALKSYGIESNFFRICLLMLMVLTFRAKIIGTIAIVTVFYLYIYVFKKKITIKRIVALIPLALVFAWSEIKSYYVLNKQASRLMLTIKSFAISKKMFPFGSGLGTFASAFSKSPYSPVYGLYGLSNIWGLSMETGQDISDTFWPMILGQFGIIALVAYVFYVYQLYKTIQDVSLYDRYIYMGCWVIFIYLLIASSSESSFVNAYAVFYGILLAILVVTASQKKCSCKYKNEV